MVIWSCRFDKCFYSVFIYKLAETKVHLNRKVLAVLANYKPEEAETVLRKILANLKKLVKNKRVLKKYINQLMMLSRLRKIENLTIKITEEMPIHYDYETDTLYLKGIEKGQKEIEKKSYLFVRNLLLDSDFTKEKIALLADVPLEFVKKVKLALELEAAQKKANT